MVWKLLIFGLIGYALYRMFTNDHKKKSTDTKKQHEQMFATGEMTKDPNCGAYVETDSSISVRDGETIYRFCSYDCRDSFLKKINKLPEKTDAH